MWENKTNKRKDSCSKWLEGMSRDEKNPNKPNKRKQLRASLKIEKKIIKSKKGREQVVEKWWSSLSGDWDEPYVLRRAAEAQAVTAVSTHPVSCLEEHRVCPYLLHTPCYILSCTNFLPLSGDLDLFFSIPWCWITTMQLHVAGVSTMAMQIFQTSKSDALGFCAIVVKTANAWTLLWLGKFDWVICLYQVIQFDSILEQKQLGEECYPVVLNGM